MRPTQRLLNAVVSAGNSHDILHTIIDGKLVMKDRQLVELDEEKIDCRCRAAYERNKQKVGDLI